MTVQREQLEADVLIVGAGPAGLSCALHLANLIKKHNASGAKPELSAENIYVLEKGREIGAHQLSGAIMNPKALAELVPDFEKTAPLDTPVTDDAALLFTKGSSFRFPITPPPFKNKGNYVISLSKVTKWLGGLVEAAGVNLFKEFGGAELIYEGDGIAGVITEDKGLDKNGKPKDNYTPGYELRAKVTVLAEGTRGSLTGSTAYRTTACRLVSSSRSNTPIRNSILTKRFKSGRRTPCSKICSMVESSFGTARSRSLTVVGTQCHEIIWMAD